MSTIKPARTPLEAYQHVLQCLDLGSVDPYEQASLASCAYEDPAGIMCSVGCLLTEDQRIDLEDRGLNQASVFALVERIGQENLEHATGLNIDQLSELQGMHDLAVKKYQHGTATGDPLYNHVLDEITRLENEHDMLTCGGLYENGN